MTKFTSADVIVVGLIGERGREVKEFIDQILGKQGLTKTVVVAAPADCSPLQEYMPQSIPLLLLNISVIRVNKFYY